MIGPVFHQVELVVLAVVERLLVLPLGLGGLVYGCFGQLLGIFGIHHILNFLEISMLSQTGWNMLNPIGTCGNMAQAGADRNPGSAPVFKQSITAVSCGKCCVNGCGVCPDLYNRI